MSLKKRIDAYIMGKGKAAREHDARAKFLTLPESGYTPKDTDPFFVRSRAILGSDETYLKFKNNFTRPNDAIELITDIWRALAKVWTAKDQLHIYTVRDVKEAPVFDFFDWWQNHGFEIYKVEPNSVVIVYADGEIVEPIHIPTNAISLISETKAQGAAGNIIYEIAYKNADDTTTYMANIEGVGVHQIYDKNLELVEELVPFWPDSLPVFRISNRDYDKAKSVKTNILGIAYPQIENYLIDYTLRRINVLYSMANVVERVHMLDGCNFNDGQVKCDGGYLKTISGGYAVNRETKQIENCPSCNANIEVGKVINVPYRAFIETKQPTSTIKFVAPDVSGLQFADEYLKNTRQGIYASCTGKDFAQANTKSFNSELSIKNAVESQESVLHELQTDLQWPFYDFMNIVGQLTYGPDNFVSYVNLGSEFLLQSKEALLLMRKESEEQGITDALGINDQLAEISYPGNPAMQNRAKAIILLNNLVGIEKSRIFVAQFELFSVALAATDWTPREMVIKMLDYKPRPLGQENDKKDD